MPLGEVAFRVIVSFTNELGKPTERFDSDFVEPVLLLPARRAVPHSRPRALRGFFFFGTDG